MDKIRISLREKICGKKRNQHYYHNNYLQIGSEEQYIAMIKEKSKIDLDGQSIQNFQTEEVDEPYPEENNYVNLLRKKQIKFNNMKKNILKRGRNGIEDHYDDS